MVGIASLPTVATHSDSPSTIPPTTQKEDVKQHKHTNTNKFVLGRASGSSPPAWGGNVTTNTVSSNTLVTTSRC